jgi:D-alanyl-D-alanine carboxypeptidase
MTMQDSIEHRLRTRFRVSTAFLAALATLVSLDSSTVMAGETAPAVRVNADGFIRDWLILAPIPPGTVGGAPDTDWLHQALDTDWLHAVGGEVSISPAVGTRYMIDGQRLAWHLTHSPTEVVGLGEAAPPGNYISGYAFTELVVPTAVRAFLGVGSSDGIEVWLNGKRVDESWTIRAFRPDEDIVAVNLLRGRNRLLLKVQSAGNKWGFALRLMGERAQGEALTAAIHDVDLDRFSHLLDLGIDINTKDGLGLTGYQAARLKGRPELMKQLAQRGAVLSAPLPTPAVLADNFFKQLVERGGYGRFPGVAVLIAQNGRILLEKGYGYADLERHTPVSTSTRFRIGSITKQFTAVAGLELRNQGKLNLGEPLSKYFPDFPRAREVTIDELLRHTSGIRDYVFRPDFYSRVSRPISQSDLIGYIAEGGYDFSPGEQFSYSNSGYMLLGSIIERVSGESYGNYLKENVLEPLGMHNTGTYDTPDPQRDALGYDWNGTHFVPALNWDQTWTASSGGLYSTVEDLYRWIQALTSDQAAGPGSQNLTRWSTLCTPEALPGGTQTGYGYGCFIGSWHGVVENHFGGSLHGASSLIVHLPAEDLTFIALTNGTYSADGLDYWSVFDRTAEFYLGEKLTKPEIQRAQLSPRELESMTGLYDLGPGGNQWPGGLLEVTRRGGRLFGAFPPQREAEIIPVADENSKSIECRWQTRDTSVKFVKGANDAVSQAIYQAGGQVIIAPKLAVVLDPNVDSRSYDALVGRYDLGNGGPWMSVSHDGRHLFAQYGSGPTYEIYPNSPTEFFWNTTNARIAFNLGPDGVVTGATLHLRGGAIREMKKAIQAQGE